MTGWERVPHALRPPLRDTWNVLRHGADAPRFAERIWVTPHDVDAFVPDARRLWTGRVRAGDWDLARMPLDEHPKVRACTEHWLHGRSWEEAGAYAEMRRLMERRGGPKDGCATHSDVVRRYAALDEVFEKVRAEGQLRTRKQLDPGAFRELGGVLINIDRHGRPVAGGGGWHRLSMSRLLRLPSIPAQLGTVHVDALPIWRSMLADLAAPT